LPPTESASRQGVLSRLGASGVDNVTLAVVVILVTNLALSLGDAAIKQISASFVLWQIFVLRSVITIPVLIAILTRRKVSLKPRHLGWTPVRSLLLTIMWGDLLRRLVAPRTRHGGGDLLYDHAASFFIHTRPSLVPARGRYSAPTTPS
jgi:hypothetical protein